jgi:hypothetical protein
VFGGFPAIPACRQRRNTHIYVALISPSSSVRRISCKSKLPTSTVSSAIYCLLGVVRRSPRAATSLLASWNETLTDACRAQIRECLQFH